MSDADREWLSAYMDDELTSAERARGVRALSRQLVQRERMGRYQLIGDAMRADLPLYVDPGFSARVREAVLKEAVEVPQRSWRQSLADFGDWLRQPALLATATGMLALAVTAGLWWNLLPSTPDGVQLAQQQPAVVHEGDLMEPLPGAGFDPVFGIHEHERLIGYKAMHAEVESFTMLPYTQLVDYDQ